MSISFFRSNEEALNQGRYRIGEKGKKNFGKLRPIERAIDEAQTEQILSTPEKEILQDLCSTIRNWLSISLSHKHRFKGIELYESMSDLTACIKALRQIKDHTVLETLHQSLNKSIEDLDTDYEALKQGQQILDELTDLLYGAKDDKNERHTQVYKEQTSSEKVKQDIEDLLKHSHDKYKTHSAPMRGYLKHFEETYENWKTFLFTCYDYPHIPNDNNRLELSHSQMKKQYRRITGQKSTAKYLKIHGEQAAFTVGFAYEQPSQKDVEDIIHQADTKHFKEQKKKQKEKSQARGKTRATKKNLQKMIRKFEEAWVKITVDSN